MKEKQLCLNSEENTLEMYNIQRATKGKDWEQAQVLKPVCCKDLPEDIWEDQVTTLSPRTTIHASV